MTSQMILYTLHRQIMDSSLYQHVRHLLQQSFIIYYGFQRLLLTFPSIFILFLIELNYTFRLMHFRVHMRQKHLEFSYFIIYLLYWELELLCELLRFHSFHITVQDLKFFLVSSLIWSRDLLSIHQYFQLLLLIISSDLTTSVLIPQLFIDYELPSMSWWFLRKLEVFSSF